MPAVNTFALYATAAVFLDFMFQITAFVALMSLDQHRYENRRLDIFCCFKMDAKKMRKPPKSILRSVFEKHYAPFILSKYAKPLILVIFIVCTCLSIMVIPSIEPGLDQQLSMAKDSHVTKYFEVRKIRFTPQKILFLLKKFCKNSLWLTFCQWGHQFIG